jgi:hypothetical protein
MSLPRPLLAATFAAAALAPVLAAQPPLAAPPAADTPCVRPTPASALTRVPVSVHAEVVDSADRAARGAVDLVAQAVGERLRALLRDGQRLEYVGRPELASPAEGWADAHQAEQRRIVNTILEGVVSHAG